MNRICNGGADNKTACFRTDNDINIKRAKLLGNGFNKRFVCIGILKQCGDIAEEYALFRKIGNAANRCNQFGFVDNNG